MTLKRWRDLSPRLWTAIASGGLVVQKTASKTTAEVGDFVDYTVTVSNQSGIALNQVQLSDWLPAVFSVALKVL